MSFFSSQMFLFCLHVSLPVCCWLLAWTQSELHIYLFLLCLSVPAFECAPYSLEWHLNVTKRRRCHSLWPAVLISISNTSSGIITFMGVSWRGHTCHFSVLTSSSWCLDEREGADKSHSLFHHTDFILHSPLMRRGSKPGWSLEIYGQQKRAGH